MKLSVGGLDIEFNHGKGETDDHTWAWVPKTKTLVTGDLVLWVFQMQGIRRRCSGTLLNGQMHYGK